MRYILLAAVPVDPRGGLPSSLEAPPVPLRRRLPHREPSSWSTAVAEDVPAVAVRAEEERPPAGRTRALYESNRVHAAMTTAGNLAAKVGTCDSFRTSQAVATMGSEVRTPGPSLCRLGDRDPRRALTANYPARSDFRVLTRSPTRSGVSDSTQRHRRAVRRFGLGTMSPRARANGPAELPVAAGERVQLKRGGDRQDDSGPEIVGVRIGRRCWEAPRRRQDRRWLEAGEVVPVQARTSRPAQARRAAQIERSGPA